ncbi:hypothetical protein BDF20DRAFT_826428 [Mycotypha africana]|uniref:uncharacterized protein n=1 Tax=Mycotypha africana TaxID=64632 RepID=UPI0023014A28|nr:uncharacterized protein BDF20DRAFT_826428 [Mycotypha africana]KAI8970243.1 hypothetical protein BDF20DRAFT_826428 [Mycotypha africana]
MGTTVQLSNIFQTLPVRLQEFKRNIKREYNKALTILQAYSIISTNIRISIFNHSYSRPSIKVISTSGNKEVTANISNIFGTKLTSQIMPFKINLTSIFDKGAVEGYISKPEWGIGRNSSDRQYFYVNGRPCMLPKMAKTLNEIYRTYISNQYPVLIVNFKIPTNAYDVNVSPDKRTIFIHEENRIVQCIMEQLQEQLEPSRSTFQMNALSPSKITLNIDSTPTNMQETTPSDNVLSNPEASSSPSNNRTLPTTPSSSSDSVKPFALENTALHKASFNSLKRPLNSPTKNILSNYVYKKPRLEVNSPSVSSLASDSLHAEQRNISVSVKATDSREFGSSEITATDSECNNSEIATAMTEPEINTLKAEEDNVKEYVETVVQIKSYSGLWKTLGRLRTIKPTNLNNFLQLHRQQSLNEDRQTYGDDNIDKSMNTTLKNAGIKNTDHNERATKALSRVITKSDFAEMKILGQFNLGFILTSLKDKDLYIIDQHASDEKYNFETLQQTTQIEGQKLISPPVLDLTVAEEHIVMDNLEIFKANGFEVEVLSENEPTQRICVLSQPVSKNTMFDKKDFSEIIHLINERPGEMVRCSRNRAMFASRACHRATRIGDVLTKRQMTTVKFFFTSPI